MWFKNVFLIVFSYSLLLHIANCDESTTKRISSNKTGIIRSRNNFELDDEFPMETQSAQCTITAGDVSASAQASTTKKLEGVCGSREVRKAFEVLEDKLMQELYVLKLMIVQLQHRNLNIISPLNLMDLPTIAIAADIRPPKKANYNFSEKKTNKTSPTAPGNSSSSKPATDFAFPNEGDPNTENRFDTGDEDESSANEMGTKAMDSSPIEIIPENTSPRDFEVHRFNNTILSNDDTQIFTYFWKIENFTQKIAQNITEIKSPIFTISGLHVRARGVLNHLNRENLYLKMESVSYETMLQEKSPNIILKSGTIFKEIETKKLFRHKIIILDQENPQSDMISQEFFNTNSGFMIPNSAITTSSYSKNDTILIKVIIYL